jgi:polar amino acid transport system substrate-binding protein
MRRAAWLIVVLLLASCVSIEFTGGEPTPDPSAAMPLLPSPTPPPGGATVAARIASRGVLVVGIRYDLPPFGYVTDEGTVAGFDVDLGREFARRWLGSSEAVQFRQVRSDTAVEHLRAGDVDLVLAALAHTQPREAGADFTLPYFRDGQALLVRAPDAAAIAGPSSLSGLRVGVVAWDEAADALRAAVPFTLTFQTYDRFDQAVGALTRGEVDAVAGLRQRLFRGQWLAPGTAVIGQYTSVPVAMAYPQNDAFFADLVNLTFQEMVADGTYATLYARWFGADPVPAVERWPGSERPALAEAPPALPVPDTIGAIARRGRLAVALVAGRAPFAAVDETGNPVGYEVNLVRLMAERWLGDPSAVDLIPTTPEGALGLVESGQADLMIGGLAHTRAAELALDFSQTTYVAGEGLLVMAGGVPVTDLQSLAGQQVAVVQGSASGEVLLAAAQAAGVALSVVPQPTLEAAIALLQEGQVAAVAADRALLLGPAYATPGLVVLPLRLTEVPLALGLPAGDSAFRDLVNLTLQVLKVEGQFDALYAVWFDDAPPALEVWPGAPYRALRLGG